MSDHATLHDLVEREAVRQLMFDYACACDRRDATALAQCFTDDIELVTPGAPVLQGPGTAATVVNTLSDMFSVTQHQVHNTRYRLEGDHATGETYCTAIHILRPDQDGKQSRLDWGIRYQDILRRVAGAWRIRRRELIIDWTDRRPLSP